MKQKEIIKKINDLYITLRKKWVKQNSKGHDFTCTYKKNQPWSYCNSCLTDPYIKSHLEGDDTVSVFSGANKTKFICFDVDEKDDLRARWMVHKIIEAMCTLGIHQKYIITSYSGRKGYHVELFFKDLIPLKKSKTLYEIVLTLSELDYKKVEFRPTFTQSIKLPLGWNYKNSDPVKGFCPYVDPFNYFMPYDDGYILTIEKIESSKILNIIDNEDHRGVAVFNNVGIPFNKKVSTPEVSKTMTVESGVNNNQYALEDLINRIENDGIQERGTRHNILKKLVILYKNVRLFNKEETKTQLIEFMKRQDIGNYATLWENVLREIDVLVHYAFENDYQLPRNLRSDPIKMYYSEQDISRILDVKSKSGRLVLCALLTHSKRHAGKDGLFYMTYELMGTISGLSEKTCTSIPVMK